MPSGRKNSFNEASYCFQRQSRLGRYVIGAKDQGRYKPAEFFVAGGSAIPPDAGLRIIVAGQANQNIFRPPQNCQAAAALRFLAFLKQNGRRFFKAFLLHDFGERVAALSDIAALPVIKKLSG